MPHDAAERVCPNTGLRLNEARPATREGRAIPPAVGEPRSRMSELPPPERRPEPLAFDPQRDRVPDPPRASPSVRSSEVNTLPPTRELQRELLGQTVGGRYKIKGVLGEGGMGTVYDAEHLGLSRQVAIKVLSSTQAKKRVAVKRFQQEARAAGAIGHPNICEVYDLGLLDDGSPYLVMEKLVGQTLAERIAKEGGLPFEDVVEVAVQVLSGLVAAHEKGIIHRDIKPENIFLARRLGCPPIIKLLDFGVSKMMAEFQTGDDALDLTRTGMVMGTPYYMSPEQARGERNLDGRVDVYATGVVMYEAIAGKRPFLAPNYNALLLAIINTNPKPLRELRPKTPPELEAIIATAMARNRNDRYASAKDLLRQLTPPAEASAGRLPAPPTPEERRRAPVLGGGRGPDSVRGGGAPIAASALVGSEVSTRQPGRRERPRPDAQSPLGPIGASSLDSSYPPDGPSATLRSRMAERDSSSREERSTRLDVKMPRPRDIEQPPARIVPPPAPAPAHDSDESIDIPIHVAVAEDEVWEDDDAPMMPDEEPTEVFRPGKHPYPLPKPKNAPVQAIPQPAPKRSPAPIAAPPPQVFPAPSSVDDWEGETVVKRPDFAPPSSRAPHPVPQPAPAGRKRRSDRPFNPDETMKLDNAGDIELIDPRLVPRRR